MRGKEALWHRRPMLGGLNNQLPMAVADVSMLTGPLPCFPFLLLEFPLDKFLIHGSVSGSAFWGTEAKAGLLEAIASWLYLTNMCTS